MNRSYSHIIFDLDGTLIDSAPSILASMQAAFDEAGLCPSRPLTKDLIGPPLNATLASLLPQGQAALVNPLAELFKSHYDETGYRTTRVYEGVDGMLRVLRHHVSRLSLATNKRLLPTQRIIDFLGWSALFDDVNTLDAYTPPLRNKSEMLLRMRKESGVSEKSMLYVGDRPEDAQAASQAGLPFLLVTWGYAPVDYLATRCPAVDDPMEISVFIRTPNDHD